MFTRGNKTNRAHVNKKKRDLVKRKGGMTRSVSL